MIRFCFHLILTICLAALLAACSSSKHYQPLQKFAPQQLQEDLDLAWQTYKQVHPSYNWYSPEEEVDRRFLMVRESLVDSLTETEFRLQLAYAVAGIRCGHTSVLPSKKAVAYSKKHPVPILPLQVKVWGPDSMIVTRANSKTSPPLNRGMIITAIDSIPVGKILHQMYQPISVDGFNTAFAEYQVSTGFAARFRWMYGAPAQNRLSLIDSSGNVVNAVIHLPAPAIDSVAPIPSIKPTTGPRLRYKNLQFLDDSITTLLRINSFSGRKTGRLIRRSFKKIDSAQRQNLVIDLRENGGGRIKNSTLLARYVADRPFRVADSVSAVGFHFPQPRAVQAHYFYRWFAWIFTKRQDDGRLHMQRFEQRLHHPKKKHHFNGNLYVLTGGRTFSASLLFLHQIRERTQLTLVGTETGGGARGSSAVMTPNLTLTHTRVRVRVPLFRIVSQASMPTTGRGVVPQVLVPPSSNKIREGGDAVLETTLRLIDKNKQSSSARPMHP